MNGWRFFALCGSWFLVGFALADRRSNVRLLAALCLALYLTTSL